MAKIASKEDTLRFLMDALKERGGLGGDLDQNDPEVRKCLELMVECGAIQFEYADDEEEIEMAAEESVWDALRQTDKTERPYVAFDLNQPEVKAAVDSLLDAGLIRMHFSKGSTWSLTDEGRKQMAAEEVAHEENEALRTVAEMGERFGWEGAIVSRRTAEPFLHRLITEDEWARLRATKTWKNMETLFQALAMTSVRLALLESGIVQGDCSVGCPCEDHK